MAANFDSYLDVEVESIERPQAPPIGHWFAKIKGFKTREQNYGEGKEKTPICTIDFTLTGPDEDVEMNGEDEAKWVNRAVNRDYTLNEEGGMFGLRKLGEDAAGADVKGLKLRDMLNAIKGQDVKIYIAHRMGKVGTDTEGVAFANVTKVLSASE